MKIILLGYGDILSRVYHLLSYSNSQIVTASRNTRHHPDSAIKYCVDLSLKPDLSSLLSDADFVIYTPTPISRDIQGYQQGYTETVDHVLNYIDAKTRFILISSTRVFRGYNNAEINDATPPLSADAKGAVLIDMENNAFKRHAKTTVVRPSGIYGRNPDRWLEMIERRKWSQEYANRIHARDLARAIVHIMDQHQPKAHYLCSDLNPASAMEISSYLADKPYEQGVFETGLHYHASHLIEEGFCFEYPSYREEIDAIAKR